MASRIHKEIVPRCRELNGDGGTSIRWNVNHPGMIEPIIAKGNRFDDVEAIY